MNQTGVAIAAPVFLFHPAAENATRKAAITLERPGGKANPRLARANYDPYTPGES
jgi:hypothetical protein